MIGHVSSRLRLQSVSLAQHWLQTLIVSVLAVFAANYLYFTNVHALESFDAGSCTPLAAGDPGKCVSDLQALLDDNRPYPGIIVDDYFGAQTLRAVIDFQSAHNLAGNGVVAIQTAHTVNEFSRGRVFSAIRPGRGFEAGPAGEAVCRGLPDSRGNHISLILIALIATRLDLLTEVFRTMSGRWAFGDPPSQETQPQMRAGYGS